MFEPPPIHLLRLAMRLHCVCINIHHKVLFPVSLFATNHENRVANCMTALNLYILDKAATPHSYMHDIGREVVGTWPLIVDSSTSQLRVKCIPSLSGIPLRQRQCRCKPNNMH